MPTSWFYQICCCIFSQYAELHNCTCREGLRGLVVRRGYQDLARPILHTREKSSPSSSSFSPLKVIQPKHFASSSRMEIVIESFKSEKTWFVWRILSSKTFHQVEKIQHNTVLGSTCDSQQLQSKETFGCFHHADEEAHCVNRWLIKFQLCLQRSWRVDVSGEWRKAEKMLICLVCWSGGRCKGRECQCDVQGCAAPARLNHGVP